MILPALGFLLLRVTITGRERFEYIALVLALEFLHVPDIRDLELTWSNCVADRGWSYLVE
jgi:hypothetical protein